MKLSELYAITSANLSLSNDDLLLITDYHNNDVNSKACNLQDLKNFIQNNLNLSKIDDILKQIGLSQNISNIINEYMENLKEDLTHCDATNGNFLTVSTNSKSFSFTAYNNIAENISKYILDTNTKSFFNTKCINIKNKLKNI